MNRRIVILAWILKLAWNSSRSETSYIPLLSLWILPVFLDLEMIELWVMRIQVQVRPLVRYSIVQQNLRMIMILLNAMGALIGVDKLGRFSQLIILVLVS